MECPLESAGSCCLPKQRPSLRSILRSFIGLWVKIWHRNKTACSESNPVQSSRSKSTTCPRKGSLLRFESNSTATSDGGAQKLRTDVGRDSKSIATKVSNPIGRKWNAMFESHKNDQRWQDELRISIWRFFEQSAFVNNHLMCYWPTIHTWSRISVWNFKFSLLTFSRSMTWWAVRWSMSKNCAKWKYFN